MNVLSLFDGMSCGQIALNRLGVKIDNYFASEVDKYAMRVTKANYPNTQHIGDVRDVNPKDLPNIDILIGGSPCQSFSFAGKKNGMSTTDEIEILSLDHYLELKDQSFEFEGQSYLFWEYMRLLKAVKPKYFLLENVLMSKKWENVLSKAIRVKPIKINSALVSAQNRNRLYWTNIGLEPVGLFGDMECLIPQPKDKGIVLKDVLESEVDEKYFLSEKAIEGFVNHTKRMKERGNGFEFKPTEGDDKSKILTTSVMRPDSNYIVHNRQPRCGDPSKGGTGPLNRNDGKTYCLDTGQSNAVEIKGGDSIRRLTPIECERLQSVPDNYTNHVSDTQRYKMLGNGWTVDVITHILGYAKF